MEILGIIGHILLIILFVVLGFLFCLLFFPFVYRVRAVKPEEGELDAKGCVRWLFGFLWVGFAYGRDGFSWDLRVIGIPVKRILENARMRKEQKAAAAGVKTGPVRAKKQPTIRPGEKPVFTADEPKVHHVDSESLRYFKDERVFGGTKKPSLRERIGSLIAKIRDIMKLAGTGMTALRKAWPAILKLLKHIRPRRIEGFLRFGFDDPSTTGKTLGLIGAVYPFLPEKLEIRPEFTEKVFGCDLFAGGHLFLIYIVINLVKIIRIREVRDLIKNLIGRRRKNG